jgi:hypothetical protein
VANTAESSANVAVVESVEVGRSAVYSKPLLGNTVVNMSMATNNMHQWRNCWNHVFYAIGARLIQKGQTGQVSQSEVTVSS